MQSEGRPADGAIDFTGFSTAQLRDLEYSIDARAYPLNYQNLQLELRRREQASAGAAQDPACWPAKLTPHAGLRGWLEAKARRLALYGPGSIEVLAASLVLRGWRRTWLGVGCKSELTVPFEKIRNVVQEGPAVRFEVQRRWRPRRFAVRLESPEHASRLAGLLPATRTPTFDREWREVHEFNRALEDNCPHAWVTPALVAINSIIFVVMAISQRRLLGFELQQLINWGANYGPLTAGAKQWWRLLTAAFLHLSIIHLLVNMWAFWSVGRLTERLFGRWVFLGLYVACAVLASLGSVAWNPTLVSIGASGAIFGIFGAFLAFLAHRQTRVPAAVFRAHWFSTLAFVLFNLISGALQPGIDNGAHVGGLLAGFILGWVLARPLESRPQPLPSLRQALAAGLLVAAAAVGGMWEAGGVGAQFPPLQQYIQSHIWYFDGETRDLMLWQQLAADEQMGLISDAALADEFKNNIVPFWQSADARLSKESLPPEQREVGGLVREFVRIRVAWAQAVVDAVSNNSQESTQKAQQLSQQASLLIARLTRLSLLEAAARRAPGLINSTPVERLQTLLSSHAYQCIAAPAFYSLPMGPHDLRTDYPAVANRIACAAQRAFERRDVATLDAMFRGNATIGDLPAGGSTYAAAASGLDDLMQYGHMSIGDLLRLTADWRHARPQSPLPGLIEAMAFEDWAWAARGHGFANTVSTQVWSVFAGRTEMASESLRESATQARSTPLWYWLSLTVGLDEGHPLDQLQVIFDQGSARFPHYRPLYRAMLRALMPRWGGSYRKVDAFINAAYAKTAPDEGFQMYAQLYWAYGLLEGDDVDIFTDALASWSSMSAGFRQLLAKYPRSDYILNAYADFACRAGDRAQYKTLRPELNRRFSASAWTRKFTLKHCDNSFGLSVPAARPAPQR
jgi:membrane associated rhomboid family serine protease